MFDNNRSAPVPAGYRPTQGIHTQPPVYFLEDLKGKVLWEAMDPDCCHFLRHVLERRRPDGLQMIFSEVKDHICILMLDWYGSYVIEKLYEVCDNEQMEQVVFSVTSDADVLMAVCLNSRGSKSMKKFIECLRTPEQKSHMISIFQSMTVPLVNHKTGVGVIRHCLYIFPEKQTQIFDVIADNLFEIATTESGAFLLREVLNSQVFPPEIRQHILSEIIENVHRLYLEPFGSRVVLHVITVRLEEGVRDIVARLTGAFACMSVNKYGTWIVNELMEIYKKEYTPQIINEIISSSDFPRVLLHPYGKDIIEHAKKHTTGAVLNSLNHQIALHSDHSRSPCHGENVKPKWKI
ncbi:pumilio homolog 12-like [Henckelia pumila]|uniref:pumilio homolog 12-like n=1 Tax=Henckelia pumila TaxID=405737 RepID=UPI003C6E400D